MQPPAYLSNFLTWLGYDSHLGFLRQLQPIIRSLVDATNIYGIFIFLAAMEWVDLRNKQRNLLEREKVRVLEMRELDIRVQNLEKFIAWYINEQLQTQAEQADMDEGREDGDGSISEECQREGRAQGKSPEANSGIDPTQANNDKKPTATTITTSTEQPGIKENAKNESKSPKNTVTPAQSGPQDTDLPQLSTGAFVHFRPISTIFTGTNPTTAGTTGATKGSVSRANSRLRSKQKDKKKSPSRTVEAKSTDEIPAYYNFPFRKMFFNRATGELGKTPTLVPSTGPGCAKEE